MTRTGALCAAGLLALPRKAILAVGVVLMALLVLALWRSGPVKNTLAWGETRPADAYRAAVAFVGKEPAVRGALNFSQLEETVIERWDVGRWRVSGYVDTQPKPGVKIHTLYYCVLQYNGADRWAIEDMQFERVE
jgi:hypothetical protein